MAKDTTAPAYSEDEARQALAPALGVALTGVRQRMLALAAHPPQVLLLEGGTEAQRQAMARWWAALQHCLVRTGQKADDLHEGETSPENGAVLMPEAAGVAPCLTCPACLQIGAGVHLEVLAFDGRISNKEDEENPGPVRAFNVDNARALKARIGDAPRSGHKRVVLLGGMDITRDAAANALLKVLEEPSPTTLFVLLAPQREQLLPTLVSRSWVMTLPWPSTEQHDAECVSWEETLAEFLLHGRGWWGLTSARGAVNEDLALRVLLTCQKALVAAGRGLHMDNALALRFNVLDAARRLKIARILEEAQNFLQYNVNPARVLDWIAVRIFMCVR